MNRIAPFVTSLLFCLIFFCNKGFSQNLSLSWSKALTNPQLPLGGTVMGRVVKMDSNGDTYVVGEFSNTADFDPGPGVADLVSTGGYDAYIAKYDVNGNYIYAKSFGGPMDDLPFGLAIGASGNLYVAGYFRGTADFDPDTGVATLVSAGSDDIFIAKYDADGNYIYAKSMGGIGLDRIEGPNGLAIDGVGNVFVSGYFNGTADFDPGPGVANLISAGGSEIFIAKYDINGNYLFANRVGGSGDDYGNSLVVDGSGNICLVGTFNATVDFDPGAGVANLTSVGASDFFIAKYDANGNYIYAKGVGGTTNSDIAYGIAVDMTNSVFITGSFSGTVDFDPGPGVVNVVGSFGGNDIFIAKYDVNGNYIYAKGMGGGSGAIGYGYSIITDGLGNVFVAGEFYGTIDFNPDISVNNLISAGLDDIFIAKYDASGNYIYATSIGSTGSDLAYGICLDANGNIHVTGKISGTADFDPGPGAANLTAPASNAYIAGYTGNSSYLYAGLIGGYSSSIMTDFGYDVAIDASSNSYVTGSFIGTVDFDPGPGVSNIISTSNTADIFIAKYDVNGDYVFVKTIGGIGADNGTGITVDAIGNIYITGSFTGTVDFDPGPGVANLISAGGTDIFFAKYDVNGNYVYAKNIGGTSSDNATSLAVDASGNVYLTGYYQGTVDFNPGAGVTNLISAGATDIFIAKYDAGGNYIYAKSIGGTNADFCNSLAIDVGGSVYITGRFAGTADFNPGAGVANLTSAGGNDIFVAKYDASGSYVYAKRIGGTLEDYGNSLAVDASGNVYITGYFQGTVDFDPGAGVANITGAGGNDIFIAKYDGSGNYVYAKTMGSTGNDNGNSLAVDGSGNVYVTGAFQGTADFDPEAGVVNLTSAGGNDIFVAKYDGNGNYIYAKRIGGVTNDNGNSITLNGLGNIYLTGDFRGIVDFDPNSGVQQQTAWNSSDIYLVKFNECPTPEISGSSATSALTTISGTTLITDGGCILLASILPNGVNPVSGTLSARNWVENSVPTFGGEPFVQRHYEITPTTNPPTSTAKLTLYFTQQEFDNFNAHPASTLDLPANPTDASGISNLRIGKYSGSSSNGTGMPGSYAGPATILDPADADILWNSTKNRWEVSFDVDGFSGFIVQTSTSPLPLTLLEFKGRLDNNNVMLDWRTADELNTDKFVIERSIDGRNYTTIGEIKAYNTAGTHFYNFTDPSVNLLPASVIYYRLKQLDINDRYSYSRITAFSLAAKRLLLLYPNPVKDKINLSITTDKAEVLKVIIVDNTGRVIKQNLLSVPGGNSLTQIDVKDLSPGIYFTRVNGESGIQNLKIIKQ